MDASAVPYEEFAEVALSYLNPLYSTARRLTASPADADDLVQETYQLAFQHYRELRSLAHCRAWLYRILHRQAATRYRRERSGPQLVLIDGGAEENDFAPTGGAAGWRRVGPDLYAGGAPRHRQLAGRPASCRDVV